MSIDSIRELFPHMGNTFGNLSAPHSSDVQLPVQLPAQPLPLESQLLTAVNLPEMSSPTNNRDLVPLDSKLQCQLFCLCVLLEAINKACIEKENVKYSSGNQESSSQLTEYQRFLCKLAQICDTRKGGDTVTSLTAHKSEEHDGPHYLVLSNSRKPSELELTKTFLTDLLNLVHTNPEELALKALRKQVLWRILEFNEDRVNFYLGALATALHDCINFCRQFGDTESDVMKQLQHLQTVATFPREWESSDTKPIFLKNCDSLLKAIQTYQQSPVSRSIDRRATQIEGAQTDSWRKLRHFIGRLHSYRRASEDITEAPNLWPEMFEKFTLECIPSLPARRFRLPEGVKDVSSVIRGAFPDLDEGEYNTHVEDLQRFKLGIFILDQLKTKSFKLKVHCEIHHHDVLLRRGKVETSGYWNDVKFIATSKPPCCLCHYHFQYPDNMDFELQAPHMNLYTKWSPAPVYEHQGSEAAERRDDVVMDIVEQLQEDTLKQLKEKVPRIKTNDSRTDSRMQFSPSRAFSETGHHAGGPRLTPVPDEDENSFTMVVEPEAGAD